MLLGKGGKWMTAAEFERNPPQKPGRPDAPADARATSPSRIRIPVRPTSALTANCIAASALICTKVLRNGQPVRLPIVAA